MKPKKLGNGKITALYERLSRDDDLSGTGTPPSKKSRIQSTLYGKETQTMERAAGTGASQATAPCHRAARRTHSMS